MFLKKEKKSTYTGEFFTFFSILLHLPPIRIQVAGIKPRVALITALAARLTIYALDFLTAPYVMIFMSANG